MNGQGGRVRALPPSGVPIHISDLLAGLRGAWAGEVALDQFRADLCRHFGVRHCFLSSSGRASISLLLKALGRLRPGRDEVVLPAFTSFSVPSAVVNAGFKAALYDLDPATLSPDPASLRRAISERTLCVVVCHLFGYPCDLDTVLGIAAEAGVPVLDDAAQAMGATYKGRPVGTFGEAGLFSLSRGKNITAVDGGIVVTNSRALAEAMDTPQGAEIGLKRQALLLLKAALLGILLHPRCYWLPLRLPFLRLGASVFDPDFPVAGLSPFQAGMGRAMLGRLGAINRARAEKAKTMLAELKAVTPETVPGAEPVFLRLPVLAGDASPAVCPELGMVRSYPLALDEIESLRPHVRGNVAVPGAKRLARSLMTLPTHGYVSRDDTRQIVRRVLG